MVTSEGGVARSVWQRCRGHAALTGSSQRLEGVTLEASGHSDRSAHAPTCQSRRGSYAQAGDKGRVRGVFLFSVSSAKT